MANKGLRTFPLDCILQDDIKLIEDEFGLTGFGIIVKLLQKAYGEYGYYLEWDSEVALSFANRNCCGVGCNVVLEVVRTALKRNIFNQEMYDKYKILTSKRMQETYLLAFKRKQRIDFIVDYSLLNADKLPENVYKIEKNVYKNQENVCNSKGIKLNKTKLNKTKLNINKDTNRTLFIYLLLNDKSEYPIYVDQVEHYKELFQNVNVEQELRNMKAWLESNPTRRKTKSGINRFVTNWLSRAQNNSGSSSNNNNSFSKVSNINSNSDSMQEVEEAEEEKQKHLEEALELSKIDWLNE